MTWKCPACRNKYWQDRKCTTCGWIWNPQNFEPNGQTGAPLGAEALTEFQDTEMAIPKAKPSRPVGATLDWALARQARARKKKPGSRGGAIDGSAAKDGRSKSRDGSGGQASGRGQTASSPRYFDLCRCRSTDTSVASSAPATDPQCDHPRSAHEDDQSANEHEGNATGSPLRTSANHANDADSHSGIGTFSRAASHAGSRTARCNAAGRDHCSRTKPAECKHTSGAASTTHKRRVARRTGERPWRTVDGDRRGAPKQIRPGGERQIGSLLKKGKTLLKGERQTQMRGEHRRQNENPE